MQCHDFMHALNGRSRLTTGSDFVVNHLLLVFNLQCHDQRMQ